MKPKTLLISSVLLAGLIGLLCMGQFCFQNGPTYEPIIFSYDKYPQYQRQVAKLLNQKTGGLLNVFPSDIGIALIDLNDDGVKEIIAYSIASGISGAGGGYTGIYSQKNAEIQLLLDHNLTFGNLAKTPHKTNGYYDIVSFVIGMSISKDKDRKHTLSWVRTYGYDYVSTDHVTDKERKAFGNENL